LVKYIKKKEVLFMIRSMVLVLLALMLLSSPAYAGWLDDVSNGVRNIKDITDTSKDVVKQPETKQDPGKDSADRDVPEARPSKTSQKSGSEEGGQDIVASEEIYGKYDFIPGDKVIFYDDFSDTDVGEFPRKWSLKGPGAGGNTVEVVDYKGKRYLRSVPPASKEEGLAGTSLFIRLAANGDMPEKFTIEFDAVLNQTNGYPNEYYLLMFDDDGWPTRMPGSIYISGEKGKSQNTATSVDKNDGRVHHIAVSVNGTFVKAYIDNQRVVNDPDAITRPVKHTGITMHANHGYSETVMFTNLRLAEGGKDIRSALNAEGKIVTHGILFDTGSDKIRPESLPTLKKILAILEENPDLKFSIEGHTDNQGKREINQPLSEKRASAVKSWLTGKGISEARLKTKGWGDTKPIDTNDMPEGRANNRRVEFVKY
jgi:outer membrane protein OmpA-like peptidoglycan-associated protein